MKQSQSWGYPGAKYNKGMEHAAKYNKGMEHADQLEIMLMSLMRQLFQAKYVEYRVPSGVQSAKRFDCKPLCVHGNN